MIQIINVKESYGQRRRDSNPTTKTSVTLGKEEMNCSVAYNERPQTKKKLKS